MVARAIHLIDCSKYDLAEKELRNVLAKDPEDYFANAYMGLCQYHLDKHEEAQQSARRAIGLLPDHPFGHYVLGLVMLETKRLKEAKDAILEAIRLDPEQAQFHGLLGYVYLGARQYQEALASADKGLSLDPTNMPCRNCRATALTQLGRMEEARETIKDALKENPEDAASFANLGWTCLHQGQHKKALEYFRESLRLKPDFEWARHGMIQALKANYIVYKGLLLFYLWMSRLSPRVRIGVIIGIVVLMRVIDVIGEKAPELKPFVTPVAILYLGFVYLTWTGTHFFNTLLRLNKFGRCALNDQERRASNCYAAMIAAAIASAVTGFVLEQLPLFMLGGFFLVMTLPVCRLFDKSGKTLDRTVLLFCAGLSVIGMLGIAALAFGNKEAANAFGSLFSIVFIIFTWTGALSGSRREEI